MNLKINTFIHQHVKTYFIGYSINRVKATSSKVFHYIMIKRLSTSIGQIYLDFSVCTYTFSYKTDKFIQYIAHLIKTLLCKDGLFPIGPLSHENPLILLASAQQSLATT